MLKNLLTMFFGSMIIQYIFMSYIMVDSYKNITTSVGKMYMSVIMGLFMVLLELLMHNAYIVIYIPFIILLLMMIYAYRKQLFVSDGEYLREMIEHHAMAILTSKQILSKTKNQYIAILARQIITTQESEIMNMKKLLSV